MQCGGRVCLSCILFIHGALCHSVIVASKPSPSMRCEIRIGRTLGATIRKFSSFLLCFPVFTICFTWLTSLIIGAELCIWKSLASILASVNSLLAYIRAFCYSLYVSSCTLCHAEGLTFLLHLWRTSFLFWTTLPAITYIFPAFSAVRPGQSRSGADPCRSFPTVFTWHFCT